MGISGDQVAMNIVLQVADNASGFILASGGFGRLVSAAFVGLF